MKSKCLTIKELKEFVNNFPEQYLDSKVMKMNNEYGCGLEEVFNIEFNLKMNENGTHSYLELD